MGTRSLALALAMTLVVPIDASAQAPEAAPAADAEAPASPDADEAVSVEPAEATTSSGEPMPETPPGYEATAVPTPPARASGAAPRRTTLPARQASDEERAGPATTAPSPSSDANVELALSINGLLSFGGLGGSTVPSLFGNADVVFAADPRLWIGLGIAFSYSETHSPGGFGVPDMKFVTSSVQVPIIFQYYFETPHVGGAIPTLRVQVTPGWSESPVGAPTPSTQAVTGALTLLGGVTWMATSWFALRVIGGLNGGFGVNVVGPVVITGNAGVQALISGVARF